MNIILSQAYSFIQIGKRGNQEDSRFPDSDLPDAGCRVFAVCDGVGGAEKGEVASSTVAEAVGKYMEGIDLSKPFTASDFSKTLQFAYDSLYNRSTPETRGMSTTLTFVCFHSRGAFCAHIGDSRIYHVRPGVGIMYQSEDHSLVNALVHSGNITPEEAINHPLSHVITRYLSATENENEKCDATTIQITDLEAGDYFFLCSDGVLHQIDNDELVRILSGDEPDSDKMSRIAEMSRDSSDNNTACLIPIKGVEGGVEPEPEEEMPAGMTTKPLDPPVELVRETPPAQPGKKGVFEKLRRWISQD